MSAGQGLKPALDYKAPRCEAEGCEVRPRMRFVGMGSFRCPWCGNVAELAQCGICDGTGSTPPADCPAGEINNGADELQNMVVDCNICRHSQPCMIPCSGCGNKKAGQR